MTQRRIQGWQLIPKVLLGTFLAVSSPLWGQEPDFSMDSLWVVSGRESLTGPGDIGASLQVYCDGEHLSLVIEIRDNSVETHPGNYYTDHLELFFSLPPDAYPRSFDPQLHPYYIYAPPLVSRGEEPVPPRHRFFSTYSEYSTHLELKEFLNQHDYPAAPAIKKDSLLVPYPSQLKMARMDYGMVHIGLFPDGRPPVLYHPENYDLLEKVLGLDLGDMSSGIVYTIDPTDYGYLVNVQVSPEALGFVVLPRMEEVHLAVEVIDTDFQNKKGVTVLSSAPSLGTSSTGRSYNRIVLQQPLQTNFSPVPDRIFDKTGYRPTFTYTTQGWVPTAVEVDALAFREQSLSQRLTEVRFMQRQMRYSREMDGSQLLSVEQLTVEYEFVNAASKELVYTLVNNHLLQAGHIPGSASPLKGNVYSETFRFPDGMPGLILVDNAILNPYGWGECGRCLDERITLFRIEKEGPRPLLEIEQGEGEPVFCHIGDQNFDGYQVVQMNWVKPGQMLVLQLLNRQNEQKKRLRISWDENGKQARLDHLP